MKKIAVINLIIFFLSFLLPSQAFAVSDNSVPVAAKKTVAEVSLPQPAVRVIEVKSAPQIIVVDASHTAILPSACAGSLGQAGDLVQKTAALNLNPLTNMPKILNAASQSGSYNSQLMLQNNFGEGVNQPANCFSLRVSRAALAIQNLAVEILPQTQKPLAVAPWQARISNPSFAPAPTAPFSSPVLPLMPFSLALGFGIDRKLTLKKKFALQKIKNILTCHQLQVLRC